MATLESRENKARKEPKLNPYPSWTPRFWHGMRMRHWLQLVLPKWYRVHPFRIPMALIVTLFAIGNSILYRIQRWRYGARIAATPIDKPPVFIIGHWRSGTTYLHELMACDEQFGYPTNYECFAPNHFLVSSSFIPPIFQYLLPSKRPMDNMETGMEYPQEDEFALCSLGAPTPYRRLAFPNDPAPYCEFLDMEQVDPGDLARWKSTMLYFTQALTCFKQKRLLLKSPPHTGRIQVLREMFPGAKFIHLVRDPLAIFPSTQRLWHALDMAQGLHYPRDVQLNEFVFSSFERMYSGFRKQSSSLGPRELCEIRYEDLVRDPIQELTRAYRDLQLGDFEAVRPNVVEWVRTRQDYVANRHELDPELVSEIRSRWRWYFETYGYAKEGGAIRTRESRRESDTITRKKI